MQIDNANDKDIKKLQAEVFKLSKSNPEIESRVYPMEDQPTNAKIFEKLEKIERKLNLIFGDNVLIDGKFQKTGVL
jgi:cell division protein FtsB